MVGVAKPDCIWNCCWKAFFLNPGRCFSSALSMPSLVNGFGSTSFMPIYVSISTIKNIHVSLPYLKYISMSSARIFEVIATIGIFGNFSRMHTVAETPSR